MPAVGQLIPPVVDDGRPFQLYDVSTKNSADGSKSDFFAMLKNVTNVKPQVNRNVCTVFSLTALLESVYLINHPAVKAAAA